MKREMRVAYLLHIFFLRPYIRECARVDIHRVALSIAAPYIKFKFCVKYFTIFIFRIGYKKEEIVTVPHIHTLQCELFVCMYLQFNIRWCLTLLRECIRSYKLYARVGIRKKNTLYDYNCTIPKISPVEWEQRDDASKLPNVARSTIYSTLVT